MFWNDLVKIYVDIADFVVDNSLAISTIFTGICTWIGTIIAKDFTDKKLEKYKLFANKELDNHKLKNQNDLEKVKSDLALKLEISKRYSLEQFKLYNDLWISLYDLKIIGDNLWEVANIKNVKAFAEQLKKTENQIDRHSLLIEDQHYSNLKDLINNFNQFKFGKTTLVELRKTSSNNYDSDINLDQVNAVINQNKELKDKYSSLLVLLKEDFKRQIRGI
jgi:hypothetical protein